MTYNQSGHTIIPKSPHIEYTFLYLTFTSIIYIYNAFINIYIQIGPKNFTFSIPQFLNIFNLSNFHNTMKQVLTFH